ncbi:hypothetical protein BX661DRAFT_178894 [Kickxella alabastrina]|uniref:uncharacterized protein n=1 Tax=Kickxella alabastrina TaxID=61397 RepID=UPI00222014AD|nr:uncharacterized protein BX661DRAFT_178894 [Kickxella alabastrina]KAI7832973.1 hypothetical protein BX661DRAFT_178894 [Kickxella alabastrina]
MAFVKLTCGNALQCLLVLSCTIRAAVNEEQGGASNRKQRNALQHWLFQRVGSVEYFEELKIHTESASKIHHVLYQLVTGHVGNSWCGINNGANQLAKMERAL